MTDSLTAVTRAWRDHAGELAAHAWDLLVNRTDVWGAYVAPERRQENERGITLTTWTAPPRRLRGQRLLTLDVLERHFGGEWQGHVMGLHTTSVENTSRFLGFDIDCHEPEKADRSAENMELALHIATVLRTLGAHVVIEDSNGAGGLHLWVVFDGVHGIPRTQDVYAFGQQVLEEVRRNLPPALAALYVRPGTPGDAGDPPRLAIETFPKQPDVGATGGFGNWLRLPGLHHTKPHWSRFLAGDRWLDGAEGVRHWLTAPRTPLSVLPHVSDPVAMGPAPVHVRRAAARAALFGRGAALERRIAGYRDRLPTDLGAGQGRSDVAFQFALFLVNALELSDAEALGELQVWNGWLATPLAEAKLRDTIQNAGRYNVRYAPRVAPVDPFTSPSARARDPFTDPANELPATRRGVRL